MNNVFKYMAGVLFAGLTMTACSPETFDHPDQNGLPTISGVDFSMDVDQSINQVTVKYEAPGVYPLWCFNGETYSTLSNLSKIFTFAGDYTVSLRLGNRNGLSQGSVTKTFHFDKTQIDLGPYMDKLVGKTWRIKYDEQGHLGCGPSGTDGTAWWSAAPNEKAVSGVYDDRIVFNADGTYTYSPGADGLTYINKDVSIWGTAGADADLDVATEEKTSTFELDIDDDSNVIIKMSAGALFPYIANDAQYNNPVYRIESITNKKMALVIDEGSIAWHFILTSEEDTPPAPPVEWVAVDSPDNLGAGFNTVGAMEFWWADGGWTQLGNPDFSYADGVYTITATTNGGAEWQAQCSIHNVTTDIVKDQYYNIRFKINASDALGRYTFKVCDEGNDDNTLIYRGDLDLAAGDNIVELTGIKSGGTFTNAKLFVDLGGAPEGLVIKLSDIIIQKGEEPAIDETDPKNIAWTTVDGADNMGAAFNSKGIMNFWWSDGGWQQLGDPDFSYADGVYSITATENGGAEWQAQCSIQNIALAINEGEAYDISVKIVASGDVARYTYKLCEQNDDDNTLVYKNDLELSAGENILQLCNLKKNSGSFSEAKMFFDLGGIAVGTEIKVSDIIVQKHKLK